MKLTFYDILGITSDAIPEEIKKAFRDLSKTHHPDSGGDPEEFHTILKAYETLIDPLLRAEYDKYGTGKDQILSIAMTIFKDIMKSNPVDISSSLENSRIEDMIQIDRAISGLQKESDKIGDIIGRIGEAPVHDFIRESLEGEMEDIKLQVEQFEENKKLTQSAYEMLGGYSFNMGEGRVNRMIITNRLYSDPAEWIV